jgi:hypothetical protein
MRNENSRKKERIKRPYIRIERSFVPIGRCLISNLIVPKIYFGRNWPIGGNRKIDLIAIDRAGTGDIHIVEVKRTLYDALTRGVEYVLSVPAHYKWVAFMGRGIHRTKEDSELLLLSQRTLLPKKGMGRVGVIEVVRMATDELGSNIKLRGERFKENEIERQIEEFVAKYKANIEFKP